MVAVKQMSVRREIGATRFMIASTMIVRYEERWGETRKGVGFL